MISKKYAYVFLAFVIISVTMASIQAYSYSFTTNYNMEDYEIVGAQKESGCPRTWFGLQKLYGKIFQKDHCTKRTCTAKESANEGNCKCHRLSKGEMCLDIFVKSTASETEFDDTSATDYCLDEYTLMEGFVNCYGLDHSYYMKIRCPDGFLCNDGRCVFNGTTDIGPASNLTIINNSIYADNITINNVTLSNVTMLRLGNNNTIAYAKSFIANNISFNESHNFTISNKTISALALEMIGLNFSFLDNLTVEKMSKEQKDCLDSQDLSMFDNIIDMLNITSNKDNNSFSIYPDNKTNITVMLDKNNSLLVGKDKKNVILISDSLNLRLMFNISLKNFISIFGNGSVLLSESDDRFNYAIRNVNFSYENVRFIENITTKNITSMSLSPLTGIICINMSKQANYSYFEKSEMNNSFMVNNYFIKKYRLCKEIKDSIGKEKKGKQKDVDGKFVLGSPNSTLMLKNRIKYKRQDSKKEFKEMYTNNDGNVKAFFYFYDEDVKMLVENNRIRKNATTYSNNFFIYEAYSARSRRPERLLKIMKKKNHDFLRHYSTNYLNADIDIINSELIQTSKKSIVKAFAPDSAGLKRYKDMLKSENYLNIKDNK